MRDILKKAAELFGITYDDLIGSSHARHVFEARAAAAYVLHVRYPVLSLGSIGGLLGGRDHSTIVSALKRAKQFIAEKDDYAAIVQQLLEEYPRANGAAERRQRRAVVRAGAAWWVRQSVPWQALAA
jgi:chromosomal replication initiation ATPase DnaA